MLDRERKSGPARHPSETILWAWLVLVALSSVVGAIVFFLLLRS